ncbi:hypothetical protein PHYBOEH_005153 [Phytophthora boehmeriae]|uniref:Uncharacterized protein n=1 Tax=Phytophthora boehmeriae TaxID=109152 RepID=A0A8T1WKA4_9STRA|nr:hypothetical protein PHYBOEH_005153 [Phytophthora boehmeriae]
MARGVIIIGDWGAHVWEIIGIVIGSIVVLCCLAACIANACGWKTEEEKAAEAEAAQTELEAAQAAELGSVVGVVPLATGSSASGGATPYTVYYMVVRNSPDTVSPQGCETRSPTAQTQL